MAIDIVNKPLKPTNYNTWYYRKLLKIPAIILHIFSDKMLSYMTYIIRLPIEIPRKVCRLFGCLRNSIKQLNNSITDVSGLKGPEKQMLQKSTFGVIKLLVYGFITENVNSFHNIVSKLVKKTIHGFEEGVKVIPGVGSVVALVRIGDTVVTSITDMVGAIASTMSGFASRLKNMFRKKPNIELSKDIDQKMDEEVAKASDLAEPAEATDKSLKKTLKKKGGNRYKRSKGRRKTKDAAI